MSDLRVEGNVFDKSESVVQTRTGAVLSANTILKTAQYSSGINTRLSPQFAGAPNFRQVDASAMEVYGVALPTVEGATSVLAALGTYKHHPLLPGGASPPSSSPVHQPAAAAAAAAEDAPPNGQHHLRQSSSSDAPHIASTQPTRKPSLPRSASSVFTLPALLLDPRKCVWFNVSDRPIVYINGKPFVLRELDTPLESESIFTGLDAGRIEQMEERLKADVEREASKYGGMLLVHDEIAPSSVIGNWVFVSQVQTSREMFVSLSATFDIEYHRIPISLWLYHQSKYFDAFIRTIRETTPKDAIVFSCRMGVNRTTFGMVAASIIRRTQLLIADRNESTFLRERESEKEKMTKLLLRLVYVLEQGLKPKANSDAPSGSAIEWALARGNLISSLTEALRGDYHVINNLVRYLSNGSKSKALVDDLIDRCEAMINLRETILVNRVRHSADPITNGSALHRATVGLERYIYLIGFASHISENAAAVSKPSATVTNPLSFKDWMESQPVLQNMLHALRRSGPKLMQLRPVEDLSTLSPLFKNRTSRVKEGEAVETNAVHSQLEASITKSRHGAVLGARTILKLDHWSSSFRIPTVIQGAPNFRRVGDLFLFGTAQPTMDGLRRIFGSLQAFTDDSIVVDGQLRLAVAWINLREEPLIYVHGQPYVLRDQYATLRNIRSYTGISSKTLEDMEKRLKADVLSEAKEYDGAVLVHRETDRHVIEGVLVDVTGNGNGQGSGQGSSPGFYRLSSPDLLPYVNSSPSSTAPPATASPVVAVGGLVDQLAHAPLATTTSAQVSAVVANSYSDYISLPTRPMSSSIATPRQVFEHMVAEGYDVSYHRVPITAEQPPETSDFDAIIRLICSYDPRRTAFIFNCQMGSGRSTVGTIIAWLVLHWLSSFEADDRQLSNAADSSTPLPAASPSVSLNPAAPAPLASASPSKRRSAPAVPLLKRQFTTDQASRSATVSSSVASPSVASPMSSGLVATTAALHVSAGASAANPFFLGTAAPAVATPSHSSAQYRSILSLMRVLPNGLECKKVVDEAIHACGAVINILGSIEHYRREAVKEEDEVKRSGCIRAGISQLKRYFYFVAFQAYLSQATPSTISELTTFTQWMAAHVELGGMLEEISHGYLESITPVHEVKLDQGVLSLTSEIADVIRARKGAVLAPLTILKSDHFPGCQKLSLLERIEGAPNFRQIFLSNFGVKTECSVFGCAVPTKSAIRRVISRTGSGPESSRLLLWTFLREEPVIYVNGNPYVLRSVDDPLKNLETTGIARERVESMEEKLRLDILSEISANNNRLLLHDEDNSGQVIPIWETVSGTGVETPKQVFEAIRQEGYAVDYLRVPITDEQAPIPEVIDELLARVLRSSDSVDLLFNCQMGRGRTTTGMVIACIVELCRSYVLNPEVERYYASDDEGDDQPPAPTPKQPAAPKLEECRVVVQLVRLLSRGKESKKITDRAIDSCSHIQNLRTAVYEFKLKCKVDINSKQRHDLLERGTNYLVRYYFLICFSNYLLDETIPTDQPPYHGVRTTFQAWLKERQEIVLLAAQSKDDFV